MTTFYIADPHFGHENIIHLCNRPFSGGDQMNRAMIDNWNDRVTDGDDVYIVGDFAYRNAISAKTLLEELKGRKHLIVGNHDKKWMKSINLEDYFVEVSHAVFTIDEHRRRIWICHYPCMTWPKYTWHVYGHIHNNKPEAFWALLKTYDMALNAGVEVNHYTPVTIEEMIANNAAWKEGD